MYIYGEIFGGCYPHPAVAPDHSVRPVQTGVYYSPRIEFSAFDLATSSAAAAAAAATVASRTFLPYADAVAIFKAAGHPYQEPLFVGKYEQVQNYEIRFVSRVPERLGLPPLTDRSNWAEGVVIKPYRVAYVEGEKGPLRPIFKRKIAEFDERAEYHQAQKWDDSDGDGESAPAAAAAFDPVDGMLLEVDSMAVPARLHAAISKVGPVTGREDVTRLREIAALLLEDFTDELSEGYGELFADLSSEQRARVTEHMKKAATRLVSAHLKQLQQL